MKNIYQVEEYISDRKFSNALKIKVTTYFSKLESRVQHLKDLSRSKKVVHLGCCDHLELIPEKMEKGQWLHGQLQKVTSNLIGIDINDEAIQFLRDFGVSDIVKGDVTNDKKINEIIDDKWDLMIAAEIVEHINNPVSFLSALRLNYKDNIEELVITVPHAFSFNNIRYSFSNCELINTDHRFWFTSYTISKVLFNAGYEVKEITFVNGHNQLKLTNFPRILFSKIFPMLRDTLVVRARF